MAKRLLLVPGTEASSLFDENGRVIWNAVSASLGLSKKELGGRPPSQWTALLSLAHKPGVWAPSRTSLEDGTDITADLVVQTPYDRLWNMIDDVFPYDWRCDIRYNAQLLNDHIAAMYTSSGGQRLTLIGHSQGCLVILAASKLEATPHDFATKVQRVILVAPPVAGTMRAAEPLIFGFPDLGAANQLKTRAAIRTWPALYQMLPSWACVLGTDMRPLPTQEQLTAIGGWTDATDIDVSVLTDMLARAREAQALLTGPFSYMGPWVDARVILGEAQNTPLTIVRNGDVMIPSSGTNEPGDTLVPMRHTVAWGGASFGAHVTALDGAREHAFLCEDEDVLTLIRKAIKADPPSPPVA
jgi:pimeloyl-ACP methyl ester carboxylesterase